MREGVSIDIVIFAVDIFIELTSREGVAWSEVGHGAPDLHGRRRERIAVRHHTDVGIVACCLPRAERIPEGDAAASDVTDRDMRSRRHVAVGHHAAVVVQCEDLAGIETDLGYMR